MEYAFEPLNTHEPDPSAQGVGDNRLHLEDAALSLRRRPIACARQIAAEAGISERHLRRLRKAEARAAARPKSAARITTDLLGAFGYAELLGTPAQRYLGEFLTEFLSLLSDHLKEDDAGLDIRWAKGNAYQTVERVREAARRRRERIEQACSFNN
jgi:hypothetical protein